MTHQLISLLILFIYFGMLASAIRFVSKKVFENTFNELSSKTIFSVVLIVPSLLLIPLAQAFFDISLMTDFFETTALLGRQATQIAIHLGTSLIGIVVLLILGRVFFTNTSPDENTSGLLIGLILVAFVIAFILFPFLSNLLLDLVPKSEIQSFR